MRLLAITLVSLIVAGCSGRVLVIDGNGKPIEGAEVSAVAPSVGDVPVRTNERGEASVPLRVGLQDTEWVHVRKKGFQFQSVDVPSKWPLKVVLKPVGNP